MFYEHIILAKKGPLARVWLAAHWDKKITKAHVFETNIEKSVEGILQPKVKLALRTSGHLLLGVVRIYSRKAKYLLADCNEAFVKIKMAFRPGMVDLPEGHREANVNAITLPEVFHDFDTALPELNDIDIEAQFSINQSRADEITMREDYGSLSLSMHDDGFGDIGFEGDTPDVVRGSLESHLHDDLLGEENNTNLNEQSEALITLNETDLSNTRLDDDGFGDEFGQPELFEGDLFGEPQPSGCLATKDSMVHIPPAESDVEDINDHFNDQPPSPPSSNPEYPDIIESPPRIQKTTNEDENENKDKIDNKTLDQSTLIQNEDESFALAPVDASAYKGITKAKRKRKLIVDETKNISGEEMKAQLANTSDIVTTLDLAPPTKRLMFWKETGGVEKLFSLPSRAISARVLFANYQRHLISHFTQLEDFSCLGTAELLALENIQNENESPLGIYNKRGRKRKVELQLISSNSSIIETNSQFLAPPEAIRQQSNTTELSRISLEIAHEQESLAPETTFFESMRSPTPIFPINDVNGQEHFQPLNDIPFTPGQIHHGTDSVDDFQHSELSPSGLNHGHLTPSHSGIENIESIPNLLSDHVTSILKEAEKIHDINLVENRSCEIASDWNDFDFTSSLVVQNTGDEQMENETDEQFEERVLNKRAAQMFYAVKTRMMTNEFLLLSQLTIKNSRKQAAQKFYSLLVLKKFRALNITQSKAYADIVIERGPLFENPKL